jgi:hypothetical protein
MDINDLTIGQAMSLAAMFAHLNEGARAVPPSPYVIGENYFIRTVTMALTGKLKSVGAQELVLTDAAWIADTGRFMPAVASAEFSEVEPFPEGKEVIVGRAAIIDAVSIPLLPRTQN